jgi:hypothetical protein
MNMQLNPNGQQFADMLARAVAQNDAATAAKETERKVHVTGAGRTLTFAYEQLRNAAEYTEEHVLLQRAIRRFYKRMFLSRDQRAVATAGEELIVELTLAGYLQNDSVTIATVGRIDVLADEYFAAHAAKAKEEWTLDVLAVEVEQLLGTDARRAVFAQFAYDYFLRTVSKEKLFGSAVADYDIALFVAVHRALLKSDPATIRSSLLHRYQQAPASSAYRQTNEMIDRVFESSTTDRLYRLVNRRGAPLRVLWRLVDEHDDAASLLQNRERFLADYESQVESEYTRINARINKGILKGVIFLIITKVLIGVAVEVPYDYMVHGGVVALPLVINLFFPPVYMVLLRFTLRLPGAANTRALSDTVDGVLYGQDAAIAQAYGGAKGFGVAFNIVYALLFAVIFGGTSWGLVSLGFSVLHLLIFFVFLSTASFLGFRLSRQIREVEVVEGQQDGISMLRDFLYIPFVVVGRWISDRYSRVNLVAMILDMVIELPLKTILHLIRQWGTFIASKKDNL